jgi:hypothetical protein
MPTPWEHLSSYIWGTGKARHFFCPVCGVAPLRVPRRKTEAGNDNVAVPSAAARPKQTQGTGVRRALSRRAKKRLRAAPSGISPLESCRPGGRHRIAMRRTPPGPESTYPRRF